MAKANDNTSPKIWGIILTLIPIAAAIGYAIAFLREMGFCNEYGIPLELIVIDNTTIFRSISNIFLLILFIFWFIGSTFTLKETDSKWTPVLQRGYLLTAILIMYIVFCIIYPPVLTGWLFILIFIVLYGLYIFLMPYGTHRNICGYLNKLKEQDDVSIKKPTSLDWLAKIIGRGGVVIVLVIILMLWISYWGGKGEAKNQQNYYFPSTYPNAVVLRIYGDKLICAPRVIGALQIEREYFIIKTDDKPSPHLIYEKVGHLSVK
jgi:hypothetical protein